MPVPALTAKMHLSHPDALPGRDTPGDRCLAFKLHSCPKRLSAHSESWTEAEQKSSSQVPGDG